MPSEEQVHWLLNGATDWKKKRELHGFQPYFSFLRIADVFRKAGKLDHNGRVDLNRYDFSDAVFHGTDLSQVDFIEADLRRAKLFGTRFQDTNFSQANLADAEFGVGYLGAAVFANAILANTHLEGTNLVGADLSWSRLWQAKLYPEESQAKDVAFPKLKKIQRVGDLIENCFELKKQFDGFILYFRGERDGRWPLRPSVMRPSNGAAFKLRGHEGEMLRELISRRPEDFAGMPSALEQMVVAQHHGLKTRLPRHFPKSVCSTFLSLRQA